MSGLQFKLIGPGMKFPGIEFPSDSQMAPDGYGRPSWRIQTSKGEIEITAARFFECRGSTEALMEAGFLRSEWVPGIAGNNATRQTVLFNDEGALLIIGNRKSSALPGRWLTVVRAGKGRYAIEIGPSETESDKIDALRARFRDEEPQTNCSGPADFQSDAQVFAVARGAAACEEIDGLLRFLKPYDGVAYSEPSAARIVRQLAELRQAFTDARSIRVVPRYKQHGNVVCWPGRGNVPPVMLS